MVKPKNGDKAALRLEWWNASELAENPANWRKHPQAQVKALRGVLADVGWAGALLYNEATGRLIDGHLRKEVAKGGQVPVLVGSWTEAQEREILATLDPLGAMAQPDQDALIALLAQIETGNQDVKALLEALANGENLPLLEPKQGLIGDDEVPEAPEPVCKVGQLWRLGEHRLLCGDSTKRDDVERLMEGRKASLCLTDPPYGVGKTYGNYEDTPENLILLIDKFLPLAKTASERILLTPGNKHQFLYPKPDWVLAWFVPAGTGLNIWGFTCWNAVFAYGKDPYLAAKRGSRPDAMIMTEASEKVVHPASKPVGVWNWFLERGSLNKNDIIFDPFGGSGTTLIACEKLGRKCRMMEIDPHYCDVIIARWEAFTGKKAELLGASTHA